MKKTTWASAIALTAGLLTLTPSAAHADATEVRNTGTVGIGAVQYRDGNYAIDGKYDALMPGGRFSGYPSTAGIWVGPGYCVRIRGWLWGTEQNPPPPEGLTDPVVLKGNRHVWFESGSYDVKALLSTDPGCAGATRSADSGLDLQTEQSG